MFNKKLLLISIIVALFGLGVILWYFIFSTPTKTPTLQGTVNLSNLTALPARFSFIFGSSSNRGNNQQTSTTEVTPPNQIPFLQVWGKPASGSAFIATTTLLQIATTTVDRHGSSTPIMKTVRATSTILMFVDRSTGYVYGYDIEKGGAYQISNTSVPGVYDAYIFGKGSRLVMRYLDADRKTIVSLVATIPHVTQGGDPAPLGNITYLQKNVTSVAVSRSQGAVSYLVPNTNGAAIYTLTPKGVSLVASSPFSEWKLSYGGEQLYATTLPSAYIEGMTVTLPGFSQLIGQKTGIMSTPDQSGILLNSMWSQSGLALFTSNGAQINVLQQKTLADKCTEGTKNIFICAVPKTLPTATEGLPDDWYQGRVSFDDTLTFIDSSHGISAFTYTPEDKYAPMDITHLNTSGDGTLISMIKKQDGSLWLLNTLLLTD